SKPGGDWRAAHAQKAVAMATIAKCSAKADEAYLTIMELERKMQEGIAKQSFSVLLYTSGPLKVAVQQFYRGCRLFITKCDSGRAEHPALYAAKRAELLGRAKTVRNIMRKLCSGLQMLKSGIK